MSRELVTFFVLGERIELPYGPEVSSEIPSRPARMRFLSYIPLAIYSSICTELSNIPQWESMFIFSNPSAWPDQMLKVLTKHLSADLK